MYHLLFLADVAFIILYGNSETQFGYGQNSMSEQGTTSVCNPRLVHPKKQLDPKKKERILKKIMQVITPLNFKMTLNVNWEHQQNQAKCSAQHNVLSEFGIIFVIRMGLFFNIKTYQFHKIISYTTVKMKIYKIDNFLCNHGIPQKVF